MDLQTLTLFCDVAELGSFAEAARKQRRDPSQVSRIIAGLEQQLALRLFTRSTRRLSLTEAGERYLLRVRPILDELSAAEEEARQLTQVPSGRLRLTASTAFGQVWLLPRLGEFYRRYPDINLDIVLSDENLDLIAADIDLAIRLAPSLQSHLVGRQLLQTRYRVVASPHYLAHNARLHKPEDITQHNCVVLNLANYRSRWLFKQLGQTPLEIKIQSRMLVSNALALRECLLQGIGPGLVAEWVIAAELANGELQDIFPDWQISATDFNTGAWLLYPSRQYLPQKTRVMIEYLLNQQ